MLLTPPVIPGASWYDTSYALRELSDAALDGLLDTVQEAPSPLAAVNIHHVHGVATRIAPDATAFALREPYFAVINFGMWLEGDGAPETAWARQAQAQMAPHASPSLYVNFLGDEGAAAVQASYRGNYARLAAFKARYDPENLFGRNQNIAPAIG